MVAQNSDVEEVIKNVSTWPATLRWRLAHRLLDMLSADVESPGRQGYSAAEAAALVSSRQPAPDDETVRQWLDEHRTEKYAK